MNDDQPTARLQALRAEHRLLDAQIAALAACDGDMLELARLKKRNQIQLLLDDAVPDIRA
jgi:hypothetical protein